jgi:hypothetical protein
MLRNTRSKLRPPGQTENELGEWELEVTHCYSLQGTFEALD